RCGPHLFLSEVYRDLLHGVAGAISELEFMKLLHDIIFLQTPDDWNTLQFWQAVHTVAYATNPQLAAEDGLGFSGISRSGRKVQGGENAEHAENRRNVIVHRDPPSRPSAGSPRASKALGASLPHSGTGRKTAPIHPRQLRPIACAALRIAR